MTERKYYWMAYEARSYNESHIESLATSRHPLTVISELRRPPIGPSMYLAYAPHPTCHLVSWQELSLEEYEIARQNGMADERADQSSSNPYR